MFCKKCQSEKAGDSFYACNKTRCKDCIKSDVMKHRQENLEKIRAYDRLRGGLSHRVAGRAEYRKTIAYSQSHKAAAERWAARYPDRRAASNAVGNAVRDGRLVPWPVCAIPECESKPQAHHPDYSRPLDVVWLCQPHHKQAHALVANEPSIKEQA